MTDRVFYPLMILTLAAVVALAAVWPQGDGARSPGPFGHAPTQQTAAARAAQAREAARIEAENARKAEAQRKADEAAAAQAAQARVRAKLR